MHYRIMGANVERDLGVRNSAQEENQQGATELDEKVAAYLASLTGIDETDPEYERHVREDIVNAEYGGAETPHFDASEIDEIIEALCSGQAGERWRKPLINACEDTSVLPIFFLCFEWVHRAGISDKARLSMWKRLFECLPEKDAAELANNHALYCYAKSRYLLEQGKRAEAIDAAREAIDLAKNHIGLFNNYTELLVERSEDQILSRNRESPSELDREALTRLQSHFDQMLRETSKPHPIHYVTLGRIDNCLGEYDSAEECFERAQHLENERFEANANNARALTTYVDEVTKIVDARSSGRAFSAFSSLRDSAGRLGEKIGEQEKQAERITERLNSERISMLEFLGFFSGIIGFIIASIEVGAGMDFASRALLILIMLGGLLIAFGAFSTLLESSAEPPRKSFADACRKLMRHKAAPVIVAGLALIVIAVVLYLVLR